MLYRLLLALSLVLVAPVRAHLAAPVQPLAPSSPAIPELRVSLPDFGAVPDGHTLNTEAFDRALSSLSAQGGGTLVIPAGIWLTGPIRLRSRVNLRLEAGALVQFSRDHTLYPMYVFDARGEKNVESMSPLYGEKLEDVAITGSGVIDGGGDAWRQIKKAKVTEAFWKNRLADGGVTNPRSDQWWPSQAALDGAEAVQSLEASGVLDPAAYEPYRVFLRPRLLRLLDCKRILIEGVTLRNSPGWTLHPWLCDDLTLRAVKIFNDRWAQNSDATDLDSCQRVHVRDCTIDTGDDGICVKSGKNASGRRLGVPTRDVLIEDCVVYEGHGGFTIGSEMSGGVRDILVRNCTFIGTAIGLRFKTARGRGGVVENIHIRGIRMTRIENAAIDFNFFYAANGKPAEAVPAPTIETPAFRNILIEDVQSVDSGTPLVMRGLPELPLRDITLRNVSLSASQGAELLNCERIRFERVHISTRVGAPLVADQVSDSTLDLLP